MLKLMRDNLKKLSWVLGAVVVAFVFAVFADYGGQGSWLTSSGGPGALGDWAARVNGETVSTNEFLNAARNLDSTYRSLLGESYDPATMNLQIGRQAAQQLAQEKVILAHARELGLTATPQEISYAIRTHPSLQNESGFIGVERYKALLRANGNSPDAFEEDMGEDLLLRKWQQMMTADIAISQDQVAREVRRQDESADIVYVQFQPADYSGDIEISEDDLADWYAANEQRYRRGEGRAFDMVVFDRLNAQSNVEISEDEARAQYDAALQSRFRVPEQRRASHILIKTTSGAPESEYEAARQAAEAALARVRAGEDFAQVAAEVSQDSTAANGGDLGFFPKGVMAIPFQQATWELAGEGDVSDVIQTQFGYHVIKLTGIQDSRVREFEEVRPEIERELSFAKAGDLVRTDAETFAANVRSSPAGFLDEAARLSIVVADSGVVHPGDAISGIGANPEVERALFSLTPDGISEPLPIARGYVVARFRETHPGGPPPLEEIRDTVAADLREERALALAQERAAEVLAAGQEDDLMALGAKMDFAVEEVLSTRRGDTIGTLPTSPVLEEAVFSTELGTLTSLADMPGGPLVFAVTSRVEVTEEDIALRSDEIREELLADRRQQLLSSISRELFEQAEVVYNDNLIQQIDNPQPLPAPADS